MCLDFPRNDGAEAGFASPHVDRESVTEEVVVRELLQNALDASVDGGPLTVEFRLEAVRTQDLPLITDYLEAFNTARKYRGDHKKVDSPTERQAIERIRECLRSPNRTTDVLACVDGGKGIDHDALRALYNTGDTTKRTGRGSVGLGHLTAFAASDLRYVLYAGRDGDGGETFGGHAILATSNADGEQRDAHGYIRGAGERRDNPASQASGSQEVPELVRAWLPQADSSGSVVAILGYSPTARVGEGSFEESVLAAAAKSFVVAVHEGQLTVTCRARGEVRASLRPDNLGKVLALVREQQRRRLGRGVRGRDAWAAYETLQAGRRLPADPELEGVSIWIRDLAPGERTLVCVFREGMWITSDVSRLGASKFGGLAPFCAVVNVEDPAREDESDSVCSLIREGEAETHSQIRPSEITDTKKKKRLEGALDRIAEALRENATTAVGRVVEPDELKIFHGKVLTRTPAPPIRRQQADREPPSDDDPPEEVVDIEVAGDDGGGDREGAGGGSGGGQSAGTGPALRQVTARGNTIGIRVASRHLGDRRWAVVWRVEKPNDGDLRMVAVLPSGADETTERQLRDTVLAIASATIRDRVYRPESDSQGRDLRLPRAPNVGEALIELANDIESPDAAMVKIRLMRARPQAS
jgi:hypothetical protein